MFGSFNLSIRSIITKLKQKYEVDTNPVDDPHTVRFIRLVYLKDLNTEFIELQKQYEIFAQKYFS